MDKNFNAKKNSLIKSIPKDWEVNDYEITFSRPKKNKYCLVIPILNEGNRIYNLLCKLKANSFNNLLDIIVVDGGSEDGSIEKIDFKELKVNTLIVMKDFGRLGSQLRIGYFFAMMLRYKGVITIDGNDKDDPKDIPTFIDLLNQGYDFIQGSRFIKGGSHENTPLIRYLAIRFIHAPLLSLASGFYWTDTTQGFRAYSQNFILSKKIGIFRSEFISYELLFYLSYIAPKKNFKCIETPSKRVYPKGSVPTKIKSFKSYLDIFNSLIKVICGDYSL